MVGKGICMEGEEICMEGKEMCMVGKGICMVGRKYVWREREHVCCGGRFCVLPADMGRSTKCRGCVGVHPTVLFGPLW